MVCCVHEATRRMRRVRGLIRRFGERTRVVAVQGVGELVNESLTRKKEDHLHGGLQGPIKSQRQG